jgi:hypothetical protein
MDISIHNKQEDDVIDSILIKQENEKKLKEQQQQI